MGVVSLGRGAPSPSRLPPQDGQPEALARCRHLDATVACEQNCEPVRFCPGILGAPLQVGAADPGSGQGRVPAQATLPFHTEAAPSVTTAVDGTQGQGLAPLPPVRPEGRPRLAAETHLPSSLSSHSSRRGTNVHTAVTQRLTALPRTGTHASDVCCKCLHCLLRDLIFPHYYQCTVKQHRTNTLLAF